MVENTRITGDRIVSFKVVLDIGYSRKNGAFVCFGDEVFVKKVDIMDLFYIQRSVGTVCKEQRSPMLGLMK